MSRTYIDEDTGYQIELDEQDDGQWKYQLANPSGESLDTATDYQDSGAAMLGAVASIEWWEDFYEKQVQELLVDKPMTEIVLN